MPEDPLPPKPPEILQKLKWLRIHGRRYRGYLVAAAIILITPIAFKELRRAADTSPTRDSTGSTDTTAPMSGRVAEDREPSRDIGGLRDSSPQALNVPRVQAINIDDPKSWHTSSQQPYPVTPPITLTWSGFETKHVVINVDGKDMITFEDFTFKSRQVINHEHLPCEEQRFKVKIFRHHNDPSEVLNLYLKVCPP